MINHKVKIRLPHLEVLHVCIYIYFLIYSFIYLWLCWVFVSVRGLSLVAASGGLSLSRPLLLRSTGSRRAGSVIVAHGPSCSVACGIFPDQGSNPCPLHWQADSQPLCHQGSPMCVYFIYALSVLCAFCIQNRMSIITEFRNFSEAAIQMLFKYKFNSCELLNRWEIIAYHF